MSKASAQRLRSRFRLVSDFWRRPAALAAASCRPELKKQYARRSHRPEWSGVRAAGLSGEQSARRKPAGMGRVLPTEPFSSGKIFKLHELIELSHLAKITLINFRASNPQEISLEPLKPSRALSHCGLALGV